VKVRNIGAVSLILALLVAACSSGEAVTKATATSTLPPITFSTFTVPPITFSTLTVPPTTTTTTAALDTEGAAAVLTVLRALAKGWNDNQLKWVAAYSDTSVSWEEFLSVQQDVIVEQLRLVAAAGVRVAGFPPDTQGPANDLIAHYQERIDAFDRLVMAIVGGDVAAEEKAAAEYAAIVNPSVMMPLIEELMRTPTVMPVMEAEGITVDEMIAAIMGAAPDR